MWMVLLQRCLQLSSAALPLQASQRLLRIHLQTSSCLLNIHTQLVLVWLGSLFGFNCILAGTMAIVIIAFSLLEALIKQECSRSVLMIIAPQEMYPRPGLGESSCFQMSIPVKDESQDISLPGSAQAPGGLPQATVFESRARTRDQTEDACE